MKDRSAIFLLVLTLIIVAFVAKGLVSYWNGQIAEYEKTSLSDVCYKYDGDSEYRSFIGKDYQGNDKEMMVFTCKFDK